MLKMKLNKITILVCVFAILASLYTGCSKDKKEEAKSKKSQEKTQQTQITKKPTSTQEPAAPKKEEKPKKEKKIEIHGKKAVLKTEKGTIEMKFYPDDAPNTVRNFIKLSNKGFYKDMIFHRVIQDFMIQTGDPTGTGSGGAGYNIKDEFNERPHLDGTVAMANSGSPNTASSQFYICQGAQPHLNGKYTVFGQVTKGLDIVYKIKKGDKLISIKVIDKE